VKFHRFPKDMFQALHWLSGIGRDPDEFRSTWRVCSEHFEPDAYDASGEKLKRGSVPFIEGTALF